MLRRVDDASCIGPWSKFRQLAEMLRIPDACASVIYLMDDLLRQQLNALFGTQTGRRFADQSEHFYLCRVCHQAVDSRKLGDVIWHEEEGHGRIPLIPRYNGPVPPLSLERVVREVERILGPDRL